MQLHWRNQLRHLIRSTRSFLHPRAPHLLSPCVHGVFVVDNLKHLFESGNPQALELQTFDWVQPLRALMSATLIVASRTSCGATAPFRECFSRLSLKSPCWRTCDLAISSSCPKTFPASNTRLKLGRVQISPSCLRANIYSETCRRIIVTSG